MLRRAPSAATKGKRKITADGSNGHEYVDLGLSVKWAAMNIGAAKANDHGGYFAWGETGNKDDYSWNTYKHGTSADDLSKYSYTDNGFALQMRDDAAYMNWGRTVRQMQLHMGVDKRRWNAGI